MQRMIDTATWDDPWFAELEPDAKLMFLYLLTNRRSTAAGAFEITVRHMAFETGLGVDRVTEVLDMLSSRVVWWPEHQVIWIRNFFRHQAANDNFTKSARNFIAGLPVPVQRIIAKQYPELVDEGIASDSDPSGTPPEPMAMGSETHTEPIPYPSASNSNSKEGSSRGGGEDAPVKPAPKPKPTRATRLPDGFTLTAGRLNYAIDAGMDRTRAEYQFERMRNWAQANGMTRKDWDAQWRNWVLKDIADNGKSATPDRPTEWRLNASGVMVEVPR